MKLIFLKSGDIIEFEPSKSKVAEHWFNFLFEYCVQYNFYPTNTDKILEFENRMKELNETICRVNDGLKTLVPANQIFFTQNENLDQTWLNEIHKKWVCLTDRYKNDLFDIPLDFKNDWTNINEHIHKIESSFRLDFNTEQMFEYGRMDELLVDDCDYNKFDLVLPYRNLGRPQYEQWLLGSDIDDETNNYNRILTSFEYVFNFDISKKTAPLAYIEWCKERSILPLAPCVPLGTFVKYNRFEVREVFYKNIRDLRIGFAL
jgi:hypothetical protein